MASTSDGSASRQTQRTGLLDLPAEIWSKIGKLVIDDLQPLTTHRIVRQAEAVRARAYHGRAMAHQPPITKTCRALREELLPHYYSIRVQISIGSSLGPSLLFFTEEPTLKAIGAWLQGIGADNRACLPAIICVTRRDEGKKVGKLLSQTWKMTLQPQCGKVWEEPTALVGMDRPTHWVRYKVKLQEPEL